jgi:tetratricopeptide (TPR) repeat protein
VSLLTNPSLKTQSEGDNLNNQDQRYTAMKSPAQQEDLDFLSSILKSSLLAIPSGESFKVKCAVKDQLMVLIQHPKTASVDTEHIFALLAETLQSGSIKQTQEVQIFVRYNDQKLPYAQRTLFIVPNTSNFSELDEFSDDAFSNVILNEHEQVPIPESEASPAIFDSSASLLTITASVVEEPFDPFTSAPFLEDKPQKSPRHNPILIAAAILLVAITFGAVGYLLMSPCILSTCKELQTAKELQNSFPRLAQNVNSEEDLTKLQQQFDSTIASLQKIPGWSPSHQNSVELATSLSSDSQEMKLLTQALQAGATAMRSSQSLTNNVNELQARSSLWRSSIAPLEAIRPNSKFYGFAQSKLSQYRSGLQSVNVQILAQNKWQKKVNDAQAAAKAAKEREANAKSLSDLQRASSTWQIVVNALIAVPQTSPSYPEARKLLNDYQPRLIAIRDRVSKQEIAATIFTQAVATAKLAEQYESQNQWQPAAIRWQQALNTIKQIPTESPLYNQAQPLAQAYLVAFEQAQTKLQITATGATASTTSTRADLEKTCTGSVRICNFTVDERFITVRITPEYEQTLQSNITGADTKSAENAAVVQKHLETLQKALEVIGDNANTAVMVFDASGQQIFTHIPRSNS